MSWLCSLEVFFFPPLPVPGPLLQWEGVLMRVGSMWAVSSCWLHTEFGAVFDAPVSCLCSCQQLLPLLCSDTTSGLSPFVPHCQLLPQDKIENSIITAIAFSHNSNRIFFLRYSKTCCVTLRKCVKIKIPVQQNSILNRTQLINDLR